MPIWQIPSTASIWLAPRCPCPRDNSRVAYNQQTKSCHIGILPYWDSTTDIKDVTCSINHPFPLTATFDLPQDPPPILHELSLCNGQNETNRPQVHRRCVLVAFEVLARAHRHLFLGKAPRKQLASKAARKTAAVSIIFS